MKSLVKTKWLYWIIALVVILLAAGSFAAYRFWYLPSQKVETGESTLQTATARRGDLILYAAGAGTLIPSSEVNVSFDISDGIQEELVELSVGVGDQVEAGDILARLDDSDRQEILLNAQRDLRELISPSAIAEMEKELAETKIDLEDKISNLVGLISPAVYKAKSFVEVFTQAETDAQVAVDQDPSEENQTLLKTAQQNLKWAVSNLVVQQQYYENEYLPDNFENYYWDNNQKVYFIDAPTDAEIASVRAEISLDKAKINELEVVLTALKNDVELPEEATGPQASAIRKARQAVDDAINDLEATNLVAPISGTVTEINASVSDLVGNEVVMVISNLIPPTLDAYFDESDWKNIQVGFPIEVIFDALPEKTFVGQVVHINPGLVSQNNTTVVYAKVELDISTTGWEDLPVGSAAGVDVIGGKAQNAVLVPVEALREISDGEYAVFVIEDGQPHMMLVEVGLQDLVYAEIISGVNQGDVVSTGQVETAQ
jgi:HlyD family secretion protein